MKRAMIVCLLLAGMAMDVSAQTGTVAVPDPGLRVMTVDRAKLDEIRVFARSESIDILVHQNKRRWFTPLCTLLLAGDAGKLDALSRKLGAAVHNEEKVGDLTLKVQWLGWAANGGSRWLSFSYGHGTDAPRTAAQIVELVREINVSGIRNFIGRYGDLPGWHRAANNISWTLSLPFEDEAFFTGSEG